MFRTLLRTLNLVAATAVLLAAGRAMAVDA